MMERIDNGMDERIGVLESIDNGMYERQRKKNKVRCENVRKGNNVMRTTKGEEEGM